MLHASPGHGQSAALARGGARLKAKQQHHETEGLEARKDIGHEHSTVVEAGLRLEISITERATRVHYKGFAEAKSAGWEHISQVALSALVVKHCLGILSPLHSQDNF